MNIKRILQSIFSNILAWAISIVCLVPLLLIIVNSLKDKKAAADMNLQLPAMPLAWENFLTVIEKGKLMTSCVYSFVYSIGSVVLCVLFASLAAYVLSRNQTKLNNLLYLYIVLGITLPINYVALTKVLMFLHLNNTRGGIILLYIILGIIPMGLGIGIMRK